MTREGINPWNPAVHLKACDTRTLLFYRDQTLKFHGQYDILDNHSQCVVTHEQVKAELATRPHIPNKNEAKALRRIMAQTHLSEAEVRAIPKYQAELAEAATAGTKPAVQEA
jgi:ribosomal protein L35